MTDKALFCTVIRAAMFPQTHRMPQIRREQYSDLYETLRGHALTLLPADALRFGEMPEPLGARWQRERLDQELLFNRYLIQQETVLRLFSQAGIPCAILKGAVSAEYYPEPVYRAMGDIDLMIRPRDRERAVRLLTENGFREFGYRDAIEQGFRKAALALELHTGISPDSDAVNDFLLNHFDRLEEKSLYGFAFPCLPEACNGLILLEHMRRHLVWSLGFRQVLDWMLYVDAHLDDPAWNTTMRPLFARYGLESFAVAITAMCQQYFGLRTEGISWAREADKALCEELFEHIFSMGNFGRKLEANQKSAAGMLRDRSLLQVLGSLQRVGLENWKLCHRHRWLRPFAWLYQIFLYLYRIVTEKYNLSVSLVVRERRRVRRVWALMDKLGLPRG